MFFNDSNIEIFNMIHSAKMLRPTQLLSGLFLAHTDISMTWAHQLKALYTKKKKTKHFSVLKYQLPQSNRKKKRKIKPRLVFPRVHSDTTFKTYFTLKDFSKRCWKHCSCHASCSKRFFWKNVWLNSRWEVRSCLLNILLTNSLVQSYKLLHCTQQSRISR